MANEFSDAIVHIGVPGLNGGGVTSGELDDALTGLAPSDATYITQTANGTLSAEQALSALDTGILKVTTGTGVLSVATGSDLPSHSHTGVTVDRGFIIDGGGDTITTGVKGDIIFGVAMTITDIYALGDQSGSIDIRHWVDDFASGAPTSGDNAYTFTMTSQVTRHVSGLNISISAADVLRLNVETVTSFERLSLTYVGTRTV